MFNFALKLWSLAFLIENEQKHEFLFVSFGMKEKAVMEWFILGMRDTTV